jgi:hypothetical protein
VIDVRPASRRLLNGLALSGTAVVAMVLGHCSGHQLHAWFAGASPATSALPAELLTGPHAHHLARAGHAAHATGPHAGHAAHATGPHAGHGALLPMASGAFLLAVTAGLALLLAVRHRGRLTVAPVRTLLCAQLLAFVLLEAAQRGGSLELWAEAAADPRVWLGLAVQPLVAWVVHRIGRRTARVVAELLAAPGRARIPGLTRLGVVVQVPVAGPADGCPTRTSARGPPGVRLRPT